MCAFNCMLWLYNLEYILSQDPIVLIWSMWMQLWNNQHSTLLCTTFAKGSHHFPWRKLIISKILLSVHWSFQSWTYICFIGVIEPPDYADITGDNSLTKSNSINNRQQPALYEDDYLQPRSQANRHLKDSHQYINVDMPGKFLIKFLWFLSYSFFRDGLNSFLNNCIYLSNFITW